MTMHTVLCPRISNSLGMVFELYISKTKHFSVSRFKFFCLYEFITQPLSQENSRPLKQRQNNGHMHSLSSQWLQSYLC
jgi:hypothetical protein